MVVPYETPTPATPVDWRRRYAIAVPALAFLHLVGTFAWLVRFVVFWDDDPHPLAERLFDLYELPLSLLAPQMMADSAGSSFVLGLINAVVWAVSLVGVWHASSAIIASRLRDRGAR